MAEFIGYQYQIGTGYVDARVVLTVNRYSNYYNLTYKLQFKRRNTGHTTSGTVNYSFYLNGKSIKSGSNTNASFSSNTTWYTAATYTKEDIPLNALKAATGTFGVKTTDNIGGNMTCNIQSVKFSVDAYATSLGKPTIQIKDNGNNSFTISGKNGSSGTNNPTNKLILYYTTNGSTPTTSSTKVEINVGASKDYSYTTSITSYGQIVKAIAYCISQNGYGNVASSIYTKAMKFYQPPSSPSNIILSFKGNKPTLKEQLTFTWNAAEEANEDSPVLGYRIRLRVNDRSITGINPQNSSANYLDTETLNTSYTLTTALKNKLKVGDKIKLGLYSYTRNGQDLQLFNGAGTAEAEVFSSEYTIGNNGVLKIKIGDKWKEGQVWIKINGTWKEATGVFIKSNNTWKESI